MKIRIRSSYLLAGIVILVALIAIYVALHFISFAPKQLSIPLSVKYSLEYFNGAVANKTLLVPAQYYKAAESMAINNNVMARNQTLYNSILSGNTSLPANEYILLDFSTLSNLSAQYNVYEFPSSYTVANISSTLRDCLTYSNKTSLLGVCGVYLGNLSNIKLGLATVAVFPGAKNISYINSTVMYNSTGGTYSYIPSYINSSSSNFRKGIAFIYENSLGYGNTTNFYIPGGIMSMFYGKEMFLPPKMLNNVFATFGGARIISGSTVHQS